MKRIKCTFCKILCELDGDYAHINVCKRHPPLEVKFYLNFDKEIYLQTIESDKLVAHTYFLNTETFDLYDRINGSAWKIHLNCNPHITPENFDDKIKTLLVFS